MQNLKPEENSFWLEMGVSVLRVVIIEFRASSYRFIYYRSKGRMFLLQMGES